MTRNRPVPKISTDDAAFVRGLVIYEDDKVIVFDKPSGLAVQGGGGVGRSLDGLLAAFAKSNGKRPRLVHRLDQGTSGVIITARTQPAAAFLSEEFAAPPLAAKSVTERQGAGGRGARVLGAKEMMRRSLQILARCWTMPSAFSGG